MVTMLIAALPSKLAVPVTAPLIWIALAVANVAADPEALPVKLPTKLPCESVMPAAANVLCVVLSTVATILPVPLSVIVQFVSPCVKLFELRLLNSLSIYALVAASCALVGSPNPVILFVPIAIVALLIVGLVSVLLVRVCVAVVPTNA